MGKKYIIELLDDCQSEFKGIMVFGLTQEKQISVELIPEEGLRPYTEPDLEQVRKEAYSNGYETAKHECEDCTKPLDNGKAYQQGLTDAWEAARWLAKNNAGVNFKVFGMHFTTEIFQNISASECIEKIRQYEQRQEDFKVGDEVISDEDIKGVTIDMDDYLLHVLDENGVVQAWPREDAVKTDRYFPEIAEVLQKMKEGK